MKTGSDLRCSTEDIHAIQRQSVPASRMRDCIAAFKWPKQLQGSSLMGHQMAFVGALEDFFIRFLSDQRRLAL